VEFAAAQMDDVPITSGDLVVSVHACGALTDVVLDRAIAAQARVAVLPCCHDRRACETGGLEGWRGSGAGDRRDARGPLVRGRLPRAHADDSVGDHAEESSAHR
jgi:hypothetical protein